MNVIYGMIAELIKGARVEENRIEVQEDGITYTLNGCRYLLNQLLRQYEIPSDHYHISDAAMEQWNKITDKNIWNYAYTNGVCVEKADIELPVYVGSKKEPEYRLFRVNEKFGFNSVFHDEHIVPIGLILTKLYELEDLSEKNIKEVLDHIHVCRILKSEDRALARSKGRFFSFEENYEKIYLPQKIILNDAKEEYEKRQITKNRGKGRK